MTAIDTRELSSRLRRIESLAWIPSVGSTNELGRRVAIECIENELAFPSALIIAGEQTGGRGRGERRWHSPAGRGIYVTLLHTRDLSALALVPLEIAVVVAEFLEEVYGIPARVKWPNDLLVEGRKIGGILIDARNRGEQAYLAIGIGLNVESLGSDAPPQATSIADAGGRGAPDTTSATEAFAEFLDGHLGSRLAADEVLERWTRRSIHQSGDQMECRIGTEMVRGRWGGIDGFGRAVLIQGDEKITISAGDLFDRSREEPEPE